MLFAWITLLVCSMSFALSFAHLMELPARMSWSQDLWVQTTVTGGLYRSFEMPGALIATGAVLLAATLAFVRRSATEAGWWIAGAVLFAVGLAVWFAFVAPMNKHLAAWRTSAVVTNFESVRAQWEYAHATIAVLLFAGLTCLIRAALAMQRV
jgi:hypothetical protein